MKTFWKFLSKGFLSICGLSLGVILALFFMLVVVTSSIGESNGFISLPDADGKIKELGKTAPILAVIEMKDAISSNKQTAKTIQNTLNSLDKSPFKGRVKGIIIDMDCPGGEVFEIARIYSSLQFWKSITRCPVYVFVNGLCASGGYYVACGADRIYSTQASLIGSVGVLSGPYFNVKEGLNRYGVESDLLSSGKCKAPMNPYTPWTSEEREARQGIIDYLYGQFVEVVSSHRPMLTKEKLENVLGARLYPPQKALEEGYIDVINATQQQVIRDLAQVCGISDDYRVVTTVQDNWLKKFVSSSANSPLITGKLKVQLPSEMDQQQSFSYLVG
ncbi:clp protease family protein [Chlamydia ibidis]|uniref:Clp protease family protein n=2 Tax=Chlamydia ibidis TaxID=1405396 RepID=S7J3L3_9CHLA|nr:S49 family peptidase [Chlamydia ibidis]EPP34617.1 clp protease family protein [Chlamydia ibidis]EQM63171.1 clp protease family protein [Chlamydia ibidis 10-1398/6]